MLIWLKFLHGSKGKANAETDGGGTQDCQVHSLIEDNDRGMKC